MTFPKAETVVEIEALANRLRAALFRLHLMSNCASLLEIGTLRREYNAVRVEVANTLEGEEANG